MDGHEAIHAYFRAFRERDRATLERLLTPAFRHLSPFGHFEDRDRMLDEIWPSVGQHSAEDIEVYGEVPAYMVRYRHSAGTLMAEYVRFEGDRIAEIEVYVGRSFTDPAAQENQ